MDHSFRTAKKIKAVNIMQQFQNVKHWIFDLDNTIYKKQTNIGKQIGNKISQFIQKYFGINEEMARKKQKLYFEKYGTTLRGLMTHHNVDPHQYLDFVHQIDISILKEDAPYADSIKNLPGKKYIMTNASKKHAQNVIEKIQIQNSIDHIFDIVDAQFQPKPQELPYQILCHKYQIKPQEAAMFEDIVDNLKIPHQMGILTIHIADETKNNKKQKWVDFKTCELKKILAEIQKYTAG